MALTLPRNFDPDLNMPYKVRGEERIHEVKDAANLARKLVENGAPDDITLAVKVLDAVFKCQELDEEDSRRGNYWWVYENGKVTDPNAADFCLSALVPMMIEHEDRLPETSRQRTRESIRLALESVARRNVTQLYTNIAVKAFVNTILGGQLLDDEAFSAQGQEKFISWMQLTDTNGIPAEYSSPTYYRVTIRALRDLARLAKDEDTRIRTRTALARLGLTKALHIHPKTERFSGPHSRAYQGTTLLKDKPERSHVEMWIEDGTFPNWLTEAMTRQPGVMEIYETPVKQMNGTISTRHTPSYSFGLATREYGNQSNVLLTHYLRPTHDTPGVIYTRFLTDDKWFGKGALRDDGQFTGVKNAGSAIGVYTLRAGFGRRKPKPISSAKTTIIWADRSGVEEILVGGKPVNDLPFIVPEGETIVITAGSVMSAVRPLVRSKLGKNTPIRLEERAGDLVLDIDTYRGEKMAHDALHETSGGRVHSAFYFEVADRSEFATARSFSKVVSSGQVQLDTTTNDSTTTLSLGYTREDRALGLDLDLTKWELKRRWTESGDLGFPMLESSIARQNRDGHVKIGDATLICGKEAGWLFAPPGTGKYIAAYHGLKPAPLKLTVPNGSIEISAMGTGTVVWNNGEVTIDAIDLEGEPIVIGGTLKSLTY
ncbi:MAG: hypothetical protein HOH77_21290 [Candidatus Latescibacteria bacterium]|nr:hypothetical protein [Candidatus Latescibacterota bacterium]